MKRAIPQYFPSRSNGGKGYDVLTPVVPASGGTTRTRRRDRTKNQAQHQTQIQSSVFNGLKQINLRRSQSVFRCSLVLAASCRSSPLITGT